MECLVVVLVVAGHGASNVLRRDRPRRRQQIGEEVEYPFQDIAHASMKVRRLGLEVKDLGHNDR